MKFENTQVMNFEGAIRGMRNPLESWDKSDSFFGVVERLGTKDLDLMQRLIKAGDADAKFLRQIFVCVDITAPLYFFKEFDTYKINTTTNSTSTMHKIQSKPITMDCFEMDDYTNIEVVNGQEANMDDCWAQILNICEFLRQQYVATKDKRYWKELIRILPEGWLQTRTFTCNYANLRNMYFQRKNHKLSEWHSFCDWVETLPYAKELLTYVPKKNN